MPRQSRLVARIGPLPAAERASYRGGRLPLYPDVVLIEGDETQAMTYGFRADGEPCGDTWDVSLEAAKAATIQDYGERIGEWIAVPEGVANAYAFARSIAMRQQGEAQ